MISCQRFLRLQMRALPQIRKASIQNAESICLCFHFQPSVEMGGTFFLTFSTEPELPAGNGKLKKNGRNYLTAIVILYKNFHKLFILFFTVYHFLFLVFPLEVPALAPKTDFMQDQWEGKIDSSNLSPPVQGQIYMYMYMYMYEYKFDILALYKCHTYGRMCGTSRTGC